VDSEGLLGVECGRGSGEWAMPPPQKMKLNLSLEMACFGAF